MTKQELTTLLRSVGVNENTVTAMENAFDLGVEQGRSEFEILEFTGHESGISYVYESLYVRKGDEA